MNKKIDQIEYLQFSIWFLYTNNKMETTCINSICFDPRVDGEMFCRECLEKIQKNLESLKCKTKNCVEERVKDEKWCFKHIVLSTLKIQIMTKKAN